MHLVQLLLPLTTPASSDAPETVIREVRQLLTEKFGGFTAFTRSPAHGAWVDTEHQVVDDDLVIVEVMTEALDHAWWRDFKSRLEAQLKQQSIVIRSSEIEML